MGVNGALAKKEKKQAEEAEYNNALIQKLANALSQQKQQVAIVKRKLGATEREKKEVEEEKAQLEGQMKLIRDQEESSVSLARIVIQQSQEFENSVLALSDFESLPGKKDKRFATTNTTISKLI